MKCFVCHEECPEFDAVLLNADGDFACGKKCEDKYYADRKDFFNRIVHSADLTERWLLGEDV